MSGQQMGASISYRKGSLSIIIHCFLLVLIHNSCPAGSEASLTESVPLHQLLQDCTDPINSDLRAENEPFSCSRSYKSPTSLILAISIHHCFKCSFLLSLLPCTMWLRLWSLQGLCADRVDLFAFPNATTACLLPYTAPLPGNSAL